MLDLLHSFLSDDATRTSFEAGTVAVAGFLAHRFLGEGLKSRLVWGIAQRVVAGIYHDYVREAKDTAAASGQPLPKALEETAHKDAVAQITKAVSEAGLSDHSLVSNPKAMDALVVNAVKAFNAGHTGPTTKGA